MPRHTSIFPALAAASLLLASCATQQTAQRPAASYPVPVARPVPGSPGMTAAGDGYQPSPYFLPEIDARPVFAASSVPYTRAESYLLIDAANGRHLASRNAEVRRSVASTQKLVTALVILDAGNLDKTVRVEAADLRVEPTVLGLRAGETYTRRNLLYVLLVKSCNDVANVLARDNAGSISAFAAKMNAKARSLGCQNSSFKNPHGLTAPGQFSTARDMARVTMAAYRHPVIRDAARRRSYTFRRNNGQMVTLKSTNDLLAFMPECNGMKTGYTNAAGRCLVSTASRAGRDVILVQLGTKTKYIWDDGRTLMSWGLQRARGSSFAFQR